MIDRISFISYKKYLIQENWFYFIFKIPYLNIGTKIRNVNWLELEREKKGEIPMHPSSGDFKLCDCIGEMDVLPETNEICVLCL